MKTVFLGGTVSNYNWRDELIKKVTNSNIVFFNPIVSNWDEEAKANEIEHRKKDDYLLYVLTPEMTGLYSIAEVVDDSNKRRENTLFCFLLEHDGKRFGEVSIRSLDMISRMLENNGSKMFNDLDSIAEFLNERE